MTYIGEICSKCGEARYLHPRPYVYTCPYCRYSFKIQPCEKYQHVVILNRGRFEK